MFVTTQMYAKMHNVSDSVIRRKILMGTLRARKMGKGWLIDSDEPYNDHRTREHRREMIMEGYSIELNGKVIEKDIMSTELALEKLQEIRTFNNEPYHLCRFSSTHGAFLFEGEWYCMLEEAHYCETHPNNHDYMASAIGKNGNRYYVYWNQNEDFNPGITDDESDACDWEHPVEVEELGWI